MPKSEHVVQAGGALETLVHQFSDPLSFYRELIQNALDAGSRVIEVDVSFCEPSEVVISVEDSGLGMTAEIIDSQLTCLFSSEKDDDLTRIGKFGIGFVSVFAVRPQRILLETARDGEGWKVEFAADGTFARSQLTQPREGTRIRLFKSATREEFEELRKRSREVLTYWCKHVDGEILFGGERIDQPLGIDSACALHWSEPDTDIVIGYARDFKPFIGFYNQGLTLLESRKDHVFPGLAVKASSRFLEHTLTRDNVVEDENFAKVMSRVGELIESELAEKLFESLERPQKERGQICACLAAHYGWQPIISFGNQELSHAQGEAEGDDWIALPDKHPPGRLCYGPYSREVGEGVHEAVFRLAVPQDAYTDPKTAVCELDVYASESESILASLALTWGDFEPHRRFQEFVLEFQTEPHQQLEFRTNWPGLVPVRHRRVLVRRPVGRKRRWSSAELARKIFRSPSGKPITLAQCRQASGDDKLSTAQSHSTLVEALEGEGHLVVAAAPGCPDWELMKALLGTSPREACREFVAPQPYEGQHSLGTGLVEVLGDLAGAWGGRLRDLRLGQSGCGQDWAAVLVGEFGRLDRLAEVALPQGGFFSREKRVLVLNVEQARVERLLSLSHKDPHLAGYLMVKHFLLPTGVTAELDSELALRAWKGRGK